MPFSFEGGGDALSGRLKESNEIMVGLAKHSSEPGFGVSVTRYWKVDSVDYKRVPELQGIDLDAYRRKGRMEIRVTIGK